jgi:hypothetical protein
MEKQTIIRSDEHGNFSCSCGNTVDDAGFYECEADGTQLPFGSGMHYQCDKCSHIFHVADVKAQELSDCTMTITLKLKTDGSLSANDIKDRVESFLSLLGGKALEIVEKKTNNIRFGSDDPYSQILSSLPDLLRLEQLYTLNNDRGLDNIEEIEYSGLVDVVGEFLPVVNH